MKSIFGWLIVLTTLLATAPASAANVDFNGGAVAHCSLSGSTYNCNNGFSMGATDVVVIAGGYTVVMTSFTPSYNQGLTISGTGALQTSGNLDLSGINPASVSTGGSTLTAGGSFKLGSSVTINGSIVAASISTNSSVTITGSVTVSGLADLGSAIKVNGNVTANAVQTNSPGTIGGAIVATTTVSMGSGLTVGGNVSGTTITSTSPVTVNGSVTASTSFTLASGSTVNGNITSPVVTLSPSSSTVKGNITASTSLDIGSGNTVTGTVKGGSLTMRASGAVINGSVTMTGDVDMGSGTTINGDLSARNVTTHSSNATVNGNAAVNAIYLDWGAAVTKTITCTGPGAVGCSCVTKADSSYNPTCGSPPPSLPHHFQISHSGTALTCQPQTVTVTACANANCTAPHFTSNADATLQPGGKVFTVSGGVNTAATVESKNAGTFTLSASGATNPSTCVNSGSGQPCEMVFKTSGLKVTAPNHVSMTAAQVTIEALTASAGNQSCVPLVTNKTVNVDVACKFSNPVNAVDTKVKVGALNATCDKGVPGATVSVPMNFNVAGIATAALEYADVGEVGLSASITTASASATGSGSFIAAPARFLVTATNAANTSLGPTELTSAPTTIFAKAGEQFTLVITAVNALNAATKNFSKENTASKVKLTASINNYNEVPVPNGTGTNGGLTYPSPLTFSQGVSTNNKNVSFDDVGYIRLTAALDDGSGTSGYYLGYQTAAFQTTGKQFISRFVPDRFTTELLQTAKGAIGWTMSCTGLATSANPCTGTSSQFIHSGQNFLLKVQAYNLAGALTKNYAGVLSREITLQAMTASGGTTVNSDGALTWSAEGPPVPTPAPARFTFTEGVGLLVPPSQGAANLPLFKFTKMYPADDVPPATVYLRATDTDLVTSQRTATPPAVPPASVEAALTVVSGRLQVGNAHGSPTASLPLPVSAQYYMPGGYVFNPQVDAISSTMISTTVKFNNCTTPLLNVGYCNAPVKLADINAFLELKAGKGSVRLAAPGALPKPGSVEINLSKYPPSGAPTHLIPGLPSSTGRATFGVYRSGPVIYTREVY
jgi:MSHA biogenesis protein MshQ